MTNEKIDVLDFRGSVAKSKTPKFGRPLTQPNQLTAKKRGKLNYLVPESIRKENLGIHWPEYDAKQGRCEVCSKKKQEVKPFMKCSASKVHLCIKEYHK